MGQYPSVTACYSVRVHRESGRAEKTLISAIVAATLGLTALYATGSLVVGSVAGRWVYPYVAPARPAALLASLAAGTAAALLSVVAFRLARDRIAAALALLVLGGASLQLLLWRIYPHAMGAIVRSDAATSFYSVARRLDAATLLRTWASAAPTFPLHALGNMPGKILLFRALHVAGATPEAMAVAILLLGNLVAVLVALVALEVLDDRPSAVAAAALWVFLPSRLVFAPILNGVSPFPIVLGLWLWLRHLRGTGPWWAAGLGVALLATLLIDPTPFGLGLVFVGAAAAARAAGRAGTGRIAAGTAIAAATLVAGALAFRAATGFDVFRELARVAAEAERFNASAGRPYGTWLVPNLVEFLATIGAPVVVVVAWGLARSRSLRDPATWMAVAGVASVLAVDLLGRNRGEVTRLWIFLAVPLVVAAAGWLARAGPVALAAAVAALVVQGGTMLSVLGFVIP